QLERVELGGGGGVGLDRGCVAVRQVLDRDPERAPRLEVGVLRALGIGGARLRASLLRGAAREIDDPVPVEIAARALVERRQELTAVLLRRQALARRHTGERRGGPRG